MNCVEEHLVERNPTGISLLNEVNQVWHLPLAAFFINHFEVAGVNRYGNDFVHGSFSAKSWYGDVRDHAIIDTTLPLLVMTKNFLA